MFNQDIFRMLLREIAETREVEIGCDECFEQVDRFVEMKLSGLNTAQAMPLVQEHLEPQASARRYPKLEPSDARRPRQERRSWRERRLQRA